MNTDTIGGVWRFSLELIAGLRAEGADIALATMGRPLSLAQREDLAAFPELEVHESTYALEWMPHPWSQVDQAGQWLKKIQTRFQADLVHLNDYSHGALDWEVPVVMVGHSCVCSWMKHVRHAPHGPEFQEYAERVRAGIQRADMIVAPTTAMLEDLEEFYGPLTAAQVIANGCDIEGEMGDDPQGESTEPFILAAGRLWDEAKNMRLLADVAPHVSWPVRLAGDHRHPYGFAPETHPGLEYLGELGRRDLYRLMRQAGIFVMPSRYEPFGLSALEAALSGCALVLSDLPSLREIWGDNAIYVDVTSSSSWALALQQLIDDEALRNSMSQRAKARAARFSRKELAQRYLDCYTQVLNREPAPCRSAVCAEEVG